MLSSTDILFYVFGGIATLSGLLVVVMSNPIYSALYLALSMCSLGALFFVLEAYFVSMAQITVYAGAVMVLFVMVVMLFDLKRDQEEVFKISPLNIVKLFSTALLCGFLIGSGWLGVTALKSQAWGVPTIATSATAGTSAQGLATDPIHRPEDEDLTNAETNSLVEMPTKSAETTTATGAPAENADDYNSTLNLSKMLFTKYVFAFEAVSLLLLIAIVGSVALARSKGGTHHVTR